MSSEAGRDANARAPCACRGWIGPTVRRGGCVELGREGEGTNGEGRTLASLPTPPPPLNINDFLYNIKGSD